MFCGRVRYALSGDTQPVGSPEFRIPSGAPERGRLDQTRFAESDTRQNQAENGARAVAAGTEAIYAPRATAQQRRRAGG